MKKGTCLKCGTSFKFRSNKKFCTATCRKLHSQQRARATSPANADNSPSIRREQAELFDLARRMAEHLYTLPPSERLGYVKDLVDLARSGASPKVKKVLTMPALLNPDHQGFRYSWRRNPHSYLTISQAAERYCRRFWGAGVVKVVKGIAPEPPTGEVTEDDKIAA